jgi:hypothetical protein
LGAGLIVPASYVVPSYAFEASPRHVTTTASNEFNVIKADWDFSDSI